MYLCICKGLTESHVRRVALDVEGNPEALVAALGLEDEDCCGRCANKSCSLASMARDALSCSGR